MIIINNIFCKNKIVSEKFEYIIKLKEISKKKKLNGYVLDNCNLR